MTKKNRIDTIKHQMLEDLDKFAARSTLLELLPRKEFNLKQVMYRSTTLFISALGRAYNIRATSSFDIIEQLKDRSEINKNTKQRLMYAVATACEIRLKRYMKCQRQIDVVQGNAANDTEIKKLLNLATKENIISYFQTAYALQCDISNIFKLDKKYFYSNPTLFSSSLYYCLGEKQKFIALTQKYKKLMVRKNRLFTFDHCMKELQLTDSKIENYRTFAYEKVAENIPLLIEFEKEQHDKLSTAEYLKKSGSYFMYVQKYDEALEYFKKENSLKEILNNCQRIKEPYTKTFQKKRRQN